MDKKDAPVIKQQTIYEVFKNLIVTSAEEYIEDNEELSNNDITVMDNFADYLLQKLSTVLNNIET